MQIKNLSNFNLYQIFNAAQTTKAKNKPSLALQQMQQRLNLQKINKQDKALTALNFKFISLKKAAENLVEGNKSVFQNLKVVSSNKHIVTASASSGASKTIHEIKVDSLAVAQKNRSFEASLITGDGDTDYDTVLTGVSGNLTINNKTVEIGVSGETDTLRNIMYKINETKDIGVETSLAGNRLVITSNGELATDIDIEDNTTGGSAGGPGGLGLTRSANSGSTDTTAGMVISPQDAQFTVYQRQINSSYTAALISGDENATANTRLTSLSGTLTINNTVFTMGVTESTDTLNNIKETINDADIGVRAEIKENRLVLTANANDTNEFKITDKTTGGLSQLGGLGLSRGENLDTRDKSAGLLQAGGGTEIFTRFTNTVDNAISNLILELKSVSPTNENNSNFTTLEIIPPNLRTKEDVESIAKSIQDLFSEFNNSMSELNNSLYTNKATNQKGALFGNKKLESMQNSLLQAVNTTTVSNGKTYNLKSIGAEIEDNKRVTLNEEKLKNILSNDFTGTENLFTSSNGIAVKIQNLLKPIYGNHTIKTGLQTKEGIDVLRENYRYSQFNSSPGYFYDFEI